MSMISVITGDVVERDDQSLTVAVHGVGFRIFAAPRTIERYELGRPATVRTYLHVREDALELYGFSTAGEQRLFEQLLSVSGVGPKLALGVLSAASVEDLEQAIERGDANVLTRVSGIGTKTAQRIIVDLRGKLADLGQAADSSLASVIDALVRLGYSAREAREAAAATPADAPIEQRVKRALQQLGR